MMDLEVTLRSFETDHRRIAADFMVDGATLAHEIDPEGWCFRAFQPAGGNPEIRIMMRRRVFLALEKVQGTGHLWIALHQEAAQQPQVARTLREEPHWTKGGLQYEASCPSVCGYVYLGDGGDEVVRQLWPAMRAFVEREAAGKTIPPEHDYSVVAALQRHGAVDIPTPGA